MVAVRWPVGAVTVAVVTWSVAAAGDLQPAHRRHRWRDTTHRMPNARPSGPGRPPLHRMPQDVHGDPRRPQPLPTDPGPSRGSGSDGIDPWWYDLDPNVWFDPRYLDNHRWGNESSLNRSDQNPGISRKTLSNYSNSNSLDFMMGHPLTVARKDFRSPQMPWKHPLEKQTSRPPADMPGGHIGLMSLFVSALTIFIMILSVFGVNARSPIDLTDVLSGLSDQVFLSHSETLQSHIANAMALFNKKFSKEEDDKIRSKRSSSVLQHAKIKSIIPVEEENSFRPGDHRKGRQYDPLSQIAISAAMVLGAYAGYSLINMNQPTPDVKKGDVRRNPPVKEEVQKLVFDDVPGDPKVSASEITKPDLISMTPQSDYLNIHESLTYPRPSGNNDKKQFTSPYSSAPPSHLTENLQPVKLQVVPTTHLDGSLQEPQVTKDTTSDSHHRPPNSGPLNPSRLGEPALSTAVNYFSGLVQDVVSTQTLESLPVINLWGKDASQEDRINLNVIPSIGGSSASLLPVHDLRPHMIPITHSDSELKDPPDLYNFVMKEGMFPSDSISQEQSAIESSYPSLRPETPQPQLAGEADSVRHEIRPSVFFRPVTLTPYQPDELDSEVHEAVESSSVKFRLNTPKPFQSHVVNHEAHVIVQSPEVNFMPLTPESHQPKVQKSQVHGLVEDSGIYLKPSTPKPHQYVLNSENNNAVDPPHMYVKPTVSYPHGGGQLTSQAHPDVNTDNLSNTFTPGGGDGSNGHHPHQAFSSPSAPPRDNGKFESSPWSKYHYEDVYHVSGHDKEEDHIKDQQPGIFIKITIPGHVPAGSKVYSSSANKDLTPSYHMDTNYRPEEQVPVQYTLSEPSETLHHHYKPSFVQPSQLSTETSISDHSWHRVPLIAAGHQASPDLVLGQQNTQKENVSPGHTVTSFGSSEVHHRFPGHQPHHTHLTYGRPQDFSFPYDRLQQTSDPSDYSNDADLASDVMLDEVTFNTLLKLAKQELESLKSYDSAPVRASFHQTRGGHVKGYSFSTEVVTNAPHRQIKEGEVNIDDYIIRPSLYVNGRLVDEEISSPEDGLGHQQEKITFPSDLLQPAILSHLDDFLQALLTNLNSTSSFKGLIIPNYISNVTRRIPEISRDNHKRDEDLELGLLLEIISKKEPSLHSHQTTTADTSGTDDNTNRTSVNTDHHDGRHETLYRSNHISGHNQSSISVPESSSETQKHVSPQGYAVPVSTDKLHATKYNQRERTAFAEGFVTWTASQRLSTWSSILENHGASTGVTGDAAFLPTKGYRWRDGDVLGSLLSSSDLPRYDSLTTFSPPSFHRTESPAATKINYPSEVSAWNTAAKASRRPSVYNRYNVQASDPVTQNMHRKSQGNKKQNRLAFSSDTGMNTDTGSMSEIPAVLAVLTKNNLRHLPTYFPDTSPEIPSKNILYSTYLSKRSGRPWVSNRSAKRKTKDQNITEVETTSVIPLMSRPVMTTDHLPIPPTTRQMARKQQMPTFGVDLGVTRLPPTPDTAQDGSQDPSLLLPTAVPQNSQHEPSFQSVHSQDSPSAASVQSSNAIRSEPFQYSLISSQSSDSPPYQIPQYRDSSDSESINFSGSHHSQSFQYRDSPPIHSQQSRDSPPIHSQQSRDSPHHQSPLTAHPPGPPTHTTSRTSFSSQSSYYRTSPEYSLNIPIDPPPSKEPFVPSSAKDSKQSMSFSKTFSKDSNEPLRSSDFSIKDSIIIASSSKASSKESKETPSSSAPPTEGSRSSVSSSTSASRDSTMDPGSPIVGLMSRFLCRHAVRHDACAVCMEEVGHRPECLIRRP